MPNLARNPDYCAELIRAAATQLLQWPDDRTNVIIVGNALRNIAHDLAPHRQGDE